MGSSSYINGVIEGISEDSFELIREDLEDAFTEVSWEGDSIEINSYGKHHDEVMLPVYDKIAFCIDKNSGRLDEEGEECGDISCIFFAPGQWERVWTEIIYPENPFHPKNNGIYYSRTAYVQVSETMFETIEMELHGWAQGNGGLCVHRDELRNLLADMESESTEVIRFLQDVENRLTCDVDDVVFHS